MKKVLVPLANGVEEMEAVISIDVLRRAGWQVTSAAVEEGVVEASRGVKLVADKNWADVDPAAFDIFLIPGGRGVKVLCDDARVLDAVRAFNAEGKTLAAVCAGPLVLQQAGILEGRKVTCHPSAAEHLQVTDRLDDTVVVDGNLITSQGPGTCFAFALALVRELENAETADRLAAEMAFA
jgi:4-methyl-5(b-hydroxyethyl)-thiazole monophosphate biosynthesis